MIEPHQILVFPYKKDANGNYLYGVFCRVGKKERWQGIAGGVEEKETWIKAAQREAFEEAGISFNAPIIALKSTCTIPVVQVTKKFLWQENVYLIEEHCFGIDATRETIKLSDEHTKMEWLPYEEACNRLTWDSNKNALWELNWKLLNNKAAFKQTIKKNHIGAYGIIIKNGQIVLIRKSRGGYKGKLDLPGGGIEHQELPHETLKRELTYFVFI